MSRIINESDMLFCVPEQDRFFYIEASDLYKKIGKGIHTTEYVYLKGNNQLQFLEAKTTCPNVHNKDESSEKRRKYESYYSELTKKYTDSLMILSAVMLGKWDNSEVGIEILKNSQLRDVNLRFLLVIKNAEEAWLSGVRAELNERLFEIRKIWKVDIQVLNEELAVRKGLVKRVDT